MKVKNCLATQRERWFRQPILLSIILLTSCASPLDCDPSDKNLITVLRCQGKYDERIAIKKEDLLHQKSVNRSLTQQAKELETSIQLTLKEIEDAAQNVESLRSQLDLLVYDKESDSGLLVDSSKRVLIAKDIVNKATLALNNLDFDKQNKKVNTVYSSEDEKEIGSFKQGLVALEAELTGLWPGSAIAKIFTNFSEILEYLATMQKKTERMLR
jgi:hypothetical protein